MNTLSGILIVAQLIGYLGLILYGGAILYYTSAARGNQDAGEKLKKIRQRFGNVATVLAGIIFAAFAIQLGWNLLLY